MKNNQLLVSLKELEQMLAIAKATQAITGSDDTCVTIALIDFDTNHTLDWRAAEDQLDTLNALKERIDVEAGERNLPPIPLKQP
jgi:hypothetical protein